MIKIIKAYHTLKQVERLQEVLHDSSLIYLSLSDAGIFPENKKGIIQATVVHDFSHILKDVLNGTDPEKAMDRLAKEKD